MKLETENNDDSLEFTLEIGTVGSIIIFLTTIILIFSGIYYFVYS